MTDQCPMIFRPVWPNGISEIPAGRGVKEEESFSRKILRKVIVFDSDMI